MNRAGRFSLVGRVRSIRFALAGLGTMLRSQQNAWAHAVATVVAIGTGAALRLERWEWGMVVLAIVAVWVAEGLNTAFEFLADVASPEFHPLVEKAKDVAAGAVLVAATGSVIIGALTFGPHFVRF